MTTRSSEHSEHTLELQFAGIFKRQEYKLYTLAFTLTKSDHYAKDIVQEVFISLWEHKNHIHHINNIDAWLYRLTENKVIDFFRMTAADKRLREALWTNMQQMLVETEETESLRKYNLIIEKAITDLPPQRQRVYRVSRVQGLNYNQIAQQPAVLNRKAGPQFSPFLESLRRLITGWFKSIF